MEEETLPNCHFQFNGKMLDIKSEKIEEVDYYFYDEPEKIKVTVIRSRGEEKATCVRVFTLENGFEDRIKRLIGEYVDEMFEL